MLAIILLYTLCFIGIIQCNEVKTIVKGNETRKIVEGRFINSNLQKTTQHTTVKVTTVNHTLYKLHNRTICNGTDTCLHRKPNLTNSNSVTVGHVASVTTPTTVQSSSTPKNVLTRTPHNVIVTHHRNITKPKILQNGTVEIKKPKDVQQLEKHETLMQKFNDQFFYLFSEQEFHPLHDKSYLFNIWYLFRHSFLNLKNVKNLIFGS
ncbi:hypothetical protein MN116_006875 [Schistosoma mekongi]|uniref:Uncharacterized protein n=1 Tax=Schistosoma mekongi TaxID=38744 RepID=A0AAE1Z815_SCHME|nr:hypothetical protein MN116_006875 [Schistosoma mekongi]